MIKLGLLYKFKINLPYQYYKVLKCCTENGCNFYDKKRYMLIFLKLIINQLLQENYIKLLVILIDQRLTWHTHICTKRKQLSMKFFKMYWSKFTTFIDAQTSDK